MVFLKIIIRDKAYVENKSDCKENRQTEFFQLLGTKS